MSDLKITCPKCSGKIELTESLAGPMMADMKAQFAAQLEAKRRETEQAVKAAELRAKAAARTGRAAGGPRGKADRSTGSASSGHEA